MANPLFGMLGGQQFGGILGMLNQLRQNPLALLQQAGFNVPTGLTDPQQIIQHLTQSGQVNQTQLNQAQQMAQLFRGLK